MNKTIAIQGYRGCFHQEAAAKYFNSADLSVLECDTFNKLGEALSDEEAPIGIMAIENSIAGSILQNYRILREHDFTIVGEVFLRIVHNLMVLPGETINDLKEVSSHPMAINQCLQFFKQYPHIKLVESNDTALSAKLVNENSIKGFGAIASKTAAELYGLEILNESIETSKINYTRFFIIQKNEGLINHDEIDKASIYLRVLDEPGCLLKVLKIIEDQNTNISKLQSYPVLGKRGEYFFHLDLEFAHFEQYKNIMDRLRGVTMELKELGSYKKATVYDNQPVG
jgi:prephenate dehydratase